MFLISEMSFIEIISIFFCFAVFSTWGTLVANQFYPPKSLRENLIGSFIMFGVLSLSFIITL